MLGITGFNPGYTGGPHRTFALLSLRRSRSFLAALKEELRFAGGALSLWNLVFCFQGVFGSRESSEKSKDKQLLIKKQEFSGGIMPMLEETYGVISTLLGTHYEREGLIKRPVNHEIPLDAIREALVNAVAHRAYDYEAPTRITLFSDRIEFLNPGTFYASINPENLKEGLSRYRNPLIADALRKKGYMEKQGIGITLIISSCLEAGLEEPQFVGLEHHVKLVMFRKNSPSDRTNTPQPP